jgi:N-acetylneuraminic acid mutarotase
LHRPPGWRAPQPEESSAHFHLRQRVLLSPDLAGFMTSNPMKTGAVSYCLAVLAIFLSLIHSARAGLWLTNIPMLSAHSGGTATLLQSGKVLIAGGETNGETTAASELYDPTAGSWTPVGSLHTARTGHSATLLLNGKVLVAGGFSDNQVTGLTYANNAELYDPVSETWTETGPLQTERYDFTATLLPDGKVLVAGGAVTDTNTDTAELYDPDTGSWTPTKNLNEARAYHTATLLPDGQVMVSGGTSNGFINPGTRSSIELYDPTQGTWTLAGTLIQERLGHTATLLPDGKVLLAGGITNGPPQTPLSSAEIYDPLTGMNSPATSMHSTRVYHSATLLPDGTVLVAGGITDLAGDVGSDGSATNSTDIYYPSTDTWILTGALNTPRAGQRAVLLPGGEILAVGGGTNENDPGLSSTELFDPTISPSTGAWTYTGSMQYPRRSFTATLLPNEKVLVTGGENGSGSAYASCELYDLATGAWTNTGSLNFARFHHAATLLADGRVLVTGSGNDLFSSVPELYDPSTELWTTNKTVPSLLTSHTATLLRNGQVLVVGFIASTNAARLYNPTSDTWTVTGPMITPRTWHKAVSLPDGKVLIVGGEASSTNVSSAEIYDPIKNQWNTAGTPRESSYSFTAAALLPSGKVLVAGVDTNSSPVAELFDPSTGVWDATGAPHTNHFLASLIVMPGGKALLGAGEAAPEIYDPATGNWTTTAPINQKRYDDRMVLLPNGTVLDIGGIDTGAIASAEIYVSGLYPSNTPRPHITSSTPTLNPGDPLIITGTGFRGISGGSGGNWEDSATDYPLVELRSIENGQTTFLLTTNWSTNSFTSLPVWNFPSGLTLATVLVNGIQSTSSVVNITVPVPVVTTVENLQVSTNGAFQFTFTNTPGAMLGVLATTNLTLPLSSWTPLSGVTEASPGAFEFTDPQATNNVQRFYQIFSP